MIRNFFILTLLAYSGLLEGQDSILLPDRSNEFTSSPQVLTVTDGLSHREVNALFQDSRGLIWFGTRKGLDRYDGYTITNWPRADFVESLSDIHMIREDAAGRLWLFAFPDQTSEPVIHLLNPNEAAPLSFEQAFDRPPPFAAKNLRGNCLKAPDRSLWMGTANPGAVAAYHPVTGFQYLPIDGIQSFAPLGFSTRQTIWGIADSTVLMEVDQQGNVLRRRRFSHPLQVTTDQTGPELIITESDPNNQFSYYLLDWRGIITDLPTDQINSSPTLSPSVFLSPAIIGNWLWAGDRLIQRPTQIIDLNPAATLPKQIIQSGGMRSRLIDRAGNLWLGTNQGVFLFHHRKNRFQRYLFSDNLTPFGYNSVRGMALIGHKLYVNHETEGIQEVDLKKGTARFLLPPESPDQQPCFAVLPWNRGHGLWLGRGKHLSFLPLDGQPAKSWPTPGIIMQIFSIEPDRLLLGTSNGLALFDVSSQTITPYTGYNGFSELAHAEIRWIGRDRNKTLWICANTGLYRIDPQDGIQNRYWSGGKDYYFLPSKEFQHLHQDADNVYWLGTQGDGLIRWNPQAFEVRKFARLDSLPNNIIYAIYEDNNQNLWMSSDLGIIKFNKVTYQSRAYLEFDGITHHEFNRVAHLRAPDGRLFFGSLNGVTAFRPDDFARQDSATHIPLVITGFQQFDQKTNRWVDRTGPLLQSGQITLGPRNSFFSLQFALLTFDKDLKPRYAYHIEGLDESWNFLHEPVIRLNRLPYGRYTLQIKGQKPDGQWSRSLLSIPIFIKKPFYLHGWFLLLAFWALTAVILGWWRLRTWKLRHNKALLEAAVARQTQLIRQDKAIIEKQSEELRQLDHVKSRFFTNLSHELRTPLTLILGPVRDLKKNKAANPVDFQRLQLIESNALILLGLVNQIQDLSRLEAGEMHLDEQPIVLYQELQQILERFCLLGQQQNITLKMTFHPAKHLMVLLDREKFEKIVSNLLFNAFKFNRPNGQVQLLVTDQGNGIQLEVADTGRGIHPDDLPFIFDRFFQSKREEVPPEGGAGIGLSLCRELTHLLGGQISVNSTWGKGATFTVQIPKKEVGSEVKPEAMILKDEKPIALQATDRKEAPEEPSFATGQGKILVVEDYPTMLSYLTSLLQPPFEVVQANNGREALAYLSQADQQPEINLVVCDIMMPVMDGLTLIQQLKMNTNWRGIPVIAITANTDLEKKLTALRIGVDDYLLKPFNPEELLARIDNLLKNYRIRRQEHTQSKQAPVAAPLPGQKAMTIAEASPSQNTMSEEDEQWLIELENMTVQHMGDFDFNLEKLSALVAISRRHFNRRLKKLTGLTPHQYVKELRLQEARRLLENKAFSTIKTVSYTVGMKDTEYFSRQFRKRFGRLPSEYLQDEAEEDKKEKYPGA